MTNKPLISGFKKKSEVLGSPDMDAFLAGNKDQVVNTVPTAVAITAPQDSVSYKTFPLPMASTFHREVQRAAFDRGVSIKSYILEAISEKIQRETGR